MHEMGSLIGGSVAKSKTKSGPKSKSGLKSKSGHKSRSKSRSKEADDNPNDPRFAIPNKVVTVNGIRKVPLVIPDESKRYAFENALKGGAPMCWRLASNTAAEFVKLGLRDATVTFTRSTEIHIYFPAFTRYFAVKSFQSQAGFTLAHIMRCVETTALGAMAFYIKNDLPEGKNGKVTAAIVRRLLRLYAMCAINIKGNRVYCITADV